MARTPTNEDSHAGRLSMRVLTREGLVGKGGVGLVACERYLKGSCSGLVGLVVGWFVGDKGKIPCVSLKCS